MKIRVADYIVEKLIEANIDTAFSVVGGGAMNLNDAFGHNEKMKVYYNHHEQACSIAAEGYSRVNNKTAAVVLTTGPGGINALNGVCGAYLDSIPMFVVSGQVRWDSFSLSTGLNLRAMGDQEFNIVESVKNMTKYAVILKDKNMVRYEVEKALYLCQTGRKGPVWIDIPGDIQSSYVETDELKGFNEYENIPSCTDEDIEYIINKIKSSKRPVLYAGSAIRTNGYIDKFRELASYLNIPVVTAWNAIDAIQTNNPLYAGRPGNFGDRFGNFTVQNSDLIISIGCRLSIRQTGFNYKSWAPKAHVIMIDVDPNELKKPTIHVEYPICSDLKIVIDKLLNKVNKNIIFNDNNKWINHIHSWMNEYPIIQEKFLSQEELANAYASIYHMSNNANNDLITVSSNGTACVVGSQAFIIKDKTRFIENSGSASMGYGLPAAFGACIANNKKQVLCLEGDGSIQMNIQELQTIIHHNLPIRIVVFNNDGYHSIRQSQTNFFKGRVLCGVGPDSYDLSFPSLEKLSYAYGYKYTKLINNKEVEEYFKTDISIPEIVEIFVDKNTVFQPKAGSQKLPNGQMVSAPLENLAPYLDEEVLKNIMKISEE